MYELLTSYVSEIKELKTDGEKLLFTITPEEFNTKINNETWSIAECFEHMNITAQLYTKALFAKLNDANELKGIPKEYQNRKLAEKIINILEPPYKKKVKTFSPFIPGDDIDLQNSLKDFTHNKELFLELIDKYQKLDIHKLKITSPASKLVKLKIGEAFKLLIVHERRHIWQAKQVLSTIENMK